MLGGVKEERDSFNGRRRIFCGGREIWLNFGFSFER